MGEALASPTKLSRKVTIMAPRWVLHMGNSVVGVPSFKQGMDVVRGTWNVQVILVKYVGGEEWGSWSNRPM